MAYVSLYKPRQMFKQTVIVEVCRYLPNLKLKHWMYRNLLNMNIGDIVHLLKVVPDLLHPEYITLVKLVARL